MSFVRILVTYDPVNQCRTFFTMNSLPFGATSSVYAFNRVAKSLWFLMVRLGSVWTTQYFDDFPNVEMESLASSSRGFMEFLLNAVSWRFAGVFFYCIAELAIKPCRSSRSKLRGEFGIPKHLQNRKQKHDKATNTPNPKHNTKQKGHGKCLEGETRGEKRVKRPKRPNALICRTPGGSIRYPLSCSLGMTLISHSIVSIPASPSRFAI